jgi:hypothetical protein
MVNEGKTGERAQKGPEAVLKLLFSRMTPWSVSLNLDNFSVDLKMPQQ